MEKLNRSCCKPILPRQLTIHLNTKPNLLSTYGQGSRLLNKALLARTKLEWEESLTQKLKSERGKPSTGIREVTQTCNYFAPLSQVDLKLQTGPSAITDQWSSGATNQPATTPMIAFDPSGATNQSADQNGSSTQYVKLIIQQSIVNQICSQSHVFTVYRFTTRNINMSMPKAVYRGSIRTSNQLKPQSDLTRARHQRPAQVCFLTVSRRSLTEAAGCPILPRQLTIQLNTKPNLLSTYGQGSRLLNKALLALTKLEWEESLTQKLKLNGENHLLEFMKLLEPATTSLLFRKSIYNSKWYQLKELSKTNPVPPISLQTMAGFYGKEIGNVGSEADLTNAHPDLIKSEILKPHRFTPNSRTGPVQIVPLTNT
ncbi:hypothetical protein F511_35351 [Dorcoceras hygrometricum]|uniref:Uncharacterized protein n=1 Tax=Dorcoceras hygrometricum TaxID=472368 RepID=A0A2Z7BKU2_9LAMI|nr:hypothetical protein F511_35351 [Dorcoceras hygrometricum]